MIIVGQTIELESVQIDVNVMISQNTVSVSVRLDAATLEVLAAHEACVDVIVRQ